tara:strand:+ start:21 stop:680 length:660 start_codon:yes stop_codon:yes gene_type:complete
MSTPSAGDISTASRTSSGGPAARRRRLSRPLVSTNAHLRTRLDDLSRLAAANDVDGFLAIFVPLDIVAADVAAYKVQLGANGGSEWANLILEINAMREGGLVTAIEGNQVTEALYKFTHPLEAACEREVSSNLQLAACGCLLHRAPRAAPLNSPPRPPLPLRPPTPTPRVRYLGEVCLRTREQRLARRRLRRDARLARVRAHDRTPFPGPWPNDPQSSA